MGARNGSHHRRGAGSVDRHPQHIAQPPSAAQAERKKAAKQAIADVASAFGAIYVMMESLSWEGELPEGPPEEKRIIEYGLRLELHLERLFGVLPLVGIFDVQACEDLKKHAQEGKEIDKQIYGAIEEKNTQKRIHRCKECQEQVEKFYNAVKAVIERALKRI